MGFMDMVNKVIGSVQNATSTAQNAKYTFDQAKNTAAAMKPAEKPTETEEPADQNQPQRT